MTAGIPTQIERQELIEEYLASDACALFKRIKVFELTHKVFLANFDEWQRAIDTKCPADPIQVVQMMQDRSWVEPYLVEITRALHNLVASAFTLIENTRVLYNERYHPTAISLIIKTRSTIASSMMGFRNSSSVSDNFASTTDCHSSPRVSVLK